MATPTIQQGRLITKRSAIPGTVPTVPAVDDIETFTPTDIFKGELFYNIPDNILYTRDNSGIVTMSGGSTYVYYTENTTPGSEQGKIQIIDGTVTSKVDVFGYGLSQLYSEDTSGANTVSYVHVFPDEVDIHVSDVVNNVSSINLITGVINIYSSDGGVNNTVMLQTPNSIITQCSNATDTTNIVQTPTSIKIEGIGSYASDAAAGTAGLIAGEIYKTSGTGSGIFATPGILMIKQ